MGISLYQSVQLFKGNRTTFGFDWFRYGGEAWTEYVKGENAGTREDIVNKHENEVAGYVDFRQDIGSWLTCRTSHRPPFPCRYGVGAAGRAGFPSAA